MLTFTTIASGAWRAVSATRTTFQESLFAKILGGALAAWLLVQGWLTFHHDPKVVSRASKHSIERAKNDVEKSRNARRESLAADPGSVRINPYYRK